MDKTSNFCYIKLPRTYDSKNNVLMREKGEGGNEIVVNLYQYQSISDMMDSVNAVVSQMESDDKLHIIVTSTNKVGIAASARYMVPVQPKFERVH